MLQTNDEEDCCEAGGPGGKGGGILYNEYILQVFFMTCYAEWSVLVIGNDRLY